MASPSGFVLESTTLSSEFAQKGHFIVKIPNPNDKIQMNILNPNNLMLGILKIDLKFGF